jgi:hypothetical protein
MISNSNFYLSVAQYETNFPWRNETFYCSRSVSGPHRVCKLSNALCAIEGCSSEVFRTTDIYDVWISVGLRSFLVHCRHGTDNAATKVCVRVHSLARSRGNSSLRAPPRSKTCRSHLQRIMDSNRPENDVLFTTQNKMSTKNNFRFGPGSSVYSSRTYRMQWLYADADHD